MDQYGSYIEALLKNIQIIQMNIVAIQSQINIFNNRFILFSNNLKNRIPNIVAII